MAKLVTTGFAHKHGFVRTHATPAVAKAAVRVGFDIPYVVTLYLCKTCLAYELESQDVLPPISITYLT